MYNLKPKAVYCHRRVDDHPLAAARMARMCAALGVDPATVPRVTSADIDAIAEVAGATTEISKAEIIKGGHGRFRQGRLRTDEAPVFIFNTFVWDSAEREPPTRQLAHPHAARTYRLLCGVGREFTYSRRALFHGESPGGYVCQGGWGLHTLLGCLHKCDYCGEGYLATLMCDLEDVADDLRRTFVERPQQNLYRYDLYSDQVCYEPEYGATEVLGGAFCETADKYLLLYTKSDNLQHLCDLPYQSNVLVNWTISTETVCREIERATPSLTERIDSMRRCQEAGYTIRCGFTPIIPVVGWREEATAMIEQLFAACRPEVVRLWVISMMEVDEAEVMFGEDLLDPYCLQRAREEAATMSGLQHAPFPQDVRNMIYEHYVDELRRVSPETPVALCTERPASWAALQPKLQMSPTRMFCPCGGNSVPGGWHGPLA